MLHVLHSDYGLDEVVSCEAISSPQDVQVMYHHI